MESHNLSHTRRAIVRAAKSRLPSAYLFTTPGSCLGRASQQVRTAWGSEAQAAFVIAQGQVPDKGGLTS